jgi:hypothetical protein
MQRIGQLRLRRNTGITKAFNRSSIALKRFAQQ